MRRNVGIAGLQNKQQQATKFKETGNEIAKVQSQQVQEQMAKFKEKLEQFALKHKKDINKNPQLRQEFNQMCAKIGVDPLATHKGFWAQLLGVGDFYYELAIQIVDISLKTREINGGLISIREVLQRLNKLRGASAQQISKDDIERAVQKLKVLGEGFKILHIGAKKMLQTVPGELNNDQTSIILLAQNKGYVTIAEVTKELVWDAARVEYALHTMMQEGMVWLDTQAGGSESLFWFPSLYSQINKVEMN